MATLYEDIARAENIDHLKWMSIEDADKLCVAYAK
jgi:hypothetical protein